MKPIILAASLALALTTNSCMNKTSDRPNPFMEAYDTPYEIPPFDKITYDDYLPAI